MLSGMSTTFLLRFATICCSHTALPSFNNGCPPPEMDLAPTSCKQGWAESSNERAQARHAPAPKRHSRKWECVLLSQIVAARGRRTMWQRKGAQQRGSAGGDSRERKKDVGRNLSAAHANITTRRTLRWLREANSRGSPRSTAKQGVATLGRSSKRAL